MEIDVTETGSRSGLNLSGSGQGPVVGLCEHGDLSSVSVIWWTFLQELSVYRCLKKGSAA
jgi:hypothetical protein